MASILIKNGLLINENQQYVADIYVADGFIAEINKNGITRSADKIINRSEEHTSELQSRSDLVCRLLLENKNKIRITT